MGRFAANIGLKPLPRNGAPRTKTGGMLPAQMADALDSSILVVWATAADREQQFWRREHRFRKSGRPVHDRAGYAGITKKKPAGCDLLRNTGGGEPSHVQRSFCLS